MNELIKGDLLALVLGMHGYKSAFDIMLTCKSFYDATRKPVFWLHGLRKELTRIWIDIWNTMPRPGFINGYNPFLAFNWPAAVADSSRITLRCRVGWLFSHEYFIEHHDEYCDFTSDDDILRLQYVSYRDDATMMFISTQKSVPGTYCHMRLDNSPGLTKISVVIGADHRMAKIAKYVELIQKSGKVYRGMGVLNQSGKVVPMRKRKRKSK